MKVPSSRGGGDMTGQIGGEVKEVGNMRKRMEKKGKGTT